MKFTKFNSKSWELKKFNEVGYDHRTKCLLIFCFDGSCYEFNNVEERTVFQLVIAKEKQVFFHDVLLKQYPHFIYKEKAPLSS